MRLLLANVLMFAGPLIILVLWGQLTRGNLGSFPLMVMGAALPGLCGVAISGLKLERKAVLAPLYIAGVALLTPMLGLFAGCAAGNCL